jgi:hypothetical protein
MNRKFGIGILILCFGFSSVNASLAAQAIEISPIIVQPYDLREISQQMLEQDRINRDQELAIRGLMGDNQKITDTALARQQEAKLEKINQTMIHYRDALLSRDRARIAANSQKVSKYHDLIALTEKVDDMKGVGLSRVQSKGSSNLVGSIALPPIIVNAPNNQQQAASDEQAEVMALRNKMRQQGLDLKAKDDAIRWLNQVVVVAKKKAEYYRLTSQQDHLTMEKVQEEVQQTVVRLGAQLSQKQQQVDLLKSELENKITEANNQAQQEAQAQQDLKAKLQDKENQITSMKTAIQSVRETQGQSDALRQQQLADQQNKNVQSDQITLMMSDYQKKLESKDNAYNQELRQALLAKNDQAQMEKQIVYLNAQLQEKEAQVVKIKKEMYDLQELMSTKDKDLQAKDLSLSIELALARQKLNGIPDSDDINFLRTGLKAAAAQLKQKDEMLSQIKANADEYEKEFKGQAREFQSLKDQLLNAQMEIIRLKDRSQLISPSKNDPLREKLKQALDKIDQQGRAINVLVQKLQDAGKSVDLTQHFTKS